MYQTLISVLFLFSEWFAHNYLCIVPRIKRWAVEQTVHPTQRRNHDETESREVGEE